MKKKDFYWSPFLSKIATEKAVVNSALNLGKYFKEYECYVINSIGEFSHYKNLKLINFFKKDIKNYLPAIGFFKTRFSYILIFLLTFFKLKRLLSNSKPEYFIIHLISPLPLLLNYFFNFDTKFILRISGQPNMNIIRVYFWKKMLKKVFVITCPTEATKNLLIKINIINAERIIVLRDPVISISEIKKKYSSEKMDTKKPYLLAAGRLTKQKNFKFLIECFKSISDEYKDLNLIILGDGELKNDLIDLINRLSLSERVRLIGYTKNIFRYIDESKCFLLSSLWEDPGFVLIEAAFFRKIIISNNCPNGPKDFFNNMYYPFLSDDFTDKKKFVQMIKNYLDNEIYYENLKINLLKKTKEYTVYQHCKKLSEILN